MPRTDIKPEIETKDRRGITEQYTIAVTVAPASIPATPGNRIEEIMVVAGANDSEKVFVSIDNGTNWFPILQWGHLAWSIKNNANLDPITQIQIKGSTQPLTAYAFINYGED